MKKRINRGLRIGLILVVVLFLMAGNFQPVQAATCIWGGYIDTNWDEAGNWTNCGGFVPGSGDDASIRDVSNAPILYTNASLNSLVIDSNAILTLGSGITLTVDSFDLLGRLTGSGDLIITTSMGWSSSIEDSDGLMDGTGTTTLNSGAYLSFPTTTYEKLGRTFINNGTINQTDAYGFSVDRGGILTNNGTINVNTNDADVFLFRRKDNPGNGLVQNAGTIMISGSGTVSSTVALENTGTIQMETGGLGLYRSSTHSGSITGDPGSTIDFSNMDSVSGFEHIFQGGSSVAVSNLYIDRADLDVSGTFNIATGPGSYLLCEGDSKLTFQESATIEDLSEKITVSSQCHLSFPASLSDFDQPKLWLNTGSHLTNLGVFSVSDELLWDGGTIDGDGNMIALVNTDYRLIGTTGMNLSEQTMINEANAKWEGGTLTLIDDASYVNQGTFNAQANTSMNGGMNGLFDNQGVFVKKTDSTTTTMDIDFIDDGDISVEAGSLVFPNGLTANAGAEIKLGGYFVTTEPLDLQGAALNGSGTLVGDLNNAGSVAPGDSPGKITVTGDYTQTAAGSLEIEIGGTTSETGYDILTVENSATLAGTLEVTLWDGFIPAVGDQFFILNSSSLSGEFGTLLLPDLPAGKGWEIAYSETAITLSVMMEDYLVFIPIVIR